MLRSMNFCNFMETRKRLTGLIRRKIGKVRVDCTLMRGAQIEDFAGCSFKWIPSYSLSPVERKAEIHSAVVLIAYSFTFLYHVARCAGASHHNGARKTVSKSYRSAYMHGSMKLSHKRVSTLGITASMFRRCDVESDFRRRFSIFSTT